MSTRAHLSGALRGLALGLVVVGCGSSGPAVTGHGGQNGGHTGAAGQGGAGNSPTTQVTLTIGQSGNPKVDILFVIDDMASTSAIQRKLADQLPSFLNVLKSGSVPPDLHIAVTTTDMGAASDVQSALGGCMPPGDNGQFRTSPSVVCNDTTLAPGATYLADDGNGTTNFTGSGAMVLQCIAPVGSSGCGFPQPLAAAVHALGADNLQGGAPTPPPSNAGFLRPDANLAIILVANEDDCSPPAGTQLFSLQGQPDNLTNPLGPLAHYRCNQYGHLCQDTASANPTALISPPLNPPADAQGTAVAPTLDLVNCRDNDTPTGLLTPVATFVSQIKALKPDPDNQILVATLIAPASPYAVAWVPPLQGSNAQPGELWPQVQHSCGAKGGDDVNPNGQFTTDGTFGDPGVRLSQFASGFSSHVVASLCDASYAATMTAIATKTAQLPHGKNCLTGRIQNNAEGLPSCSVTAQVADGGATTTTVLYPNCADSGNTPPCWSAVAPSPTCDGTAFATMDAAGAPSSSITVTCTLCSAPGSGVPGC